MPETTDPLRIPIGRNVTYAVRGMPEVANQYGPGFLVPTEVSLTYRATEDSQLGRFHAYVKGQWRRDGEVVATDQKLPGQHYYGDPSTWPAWLAAEARLHDPDAAPSAPADRAAVYTEVADRLAADAEQGAKEGFTRIYRRSAAKQVREWGEELRRMAGEAQLGSSTTCPHCKRWYVTSEPGVHEDSCPMKPGPSRMADEAQQPLVSTVDKADALGMTDTEYRARSHEAAVEQIRVAVQGLYADVGLRVEDALGEAQQPETQAADEPPCTCAAAGDCFAPAGHYADCPAAVSQPGKEATS